MGVMQQDGVAALLKDELLIQDLANALVADAEIREDLAAEIADKLGEIIEDAS